MHTHSQVSYHLSVFVVDLLMPNSEPHSVCDGHELPQCSHHPGPSPQLYSLERRDYYSGTPTAGHVVPLLPFKFLHVYVPLQCNSLLTHLHSPKMHVCVHSHVLAHTHTQSDNKGQCSWNRLVLSRLHPDPYHTVQQADQDD